MSVSPQKHTVEANKGLRKNFQIGIRQMTHDAGIHIGPLVSNSEGDVCSLIRRNLESFDGEETVLVAMFRRLRHLYEIYSQEGCQFLVASDASQQHQVVACVGLGPFHGLPISEGVGEIRDLVVELSYRGQGIGKLLLDRSIDAAKKFGYRRLYLETSHSMIIAQRLFESRGFRPVTGKNPLLIKNNGPSNSDIPCYYLLENL